MEKANEEVIALTKSSKELAQALALVKKSNDGKEAKQLSEKTDKLTKSTKKLKDSLIAEERVKQQILRANAKLAESRTKAAKDLALVRQKTLQQNKALREQAKASLDVKKANNGLISGLKAMGKQLAGALGVTALIGLLVNQFKKASERATELNKLTRELKGTFDITTKEAKKLAAQINAIAQNIDGVDSKNLQISLTTIVKTFKDLSEQEALDLIQEGFAKGSNNSGEFLDILKEYPSFFKKAGLSASEMFAIINQQVKEGVYSDKGVDAIKEATISLTENTQIVKDALRPLGESINLQIRQKVEAGKAFEAMQLISKEMETLGVNSAEAQTIMADVFKGAGEDSDAFVRNLHNVNLSLEDVAKQTSIVSEANLKLSESYNNFLLSVEDGSGIISNAIADITNMGSEFLETARIFNETNIENKLKILANAFLFIAEKALKPFVLVLEALGVEMPELRFEITNTSEALKLSTIDHKENTRVIKEETEAVVKLTAAQIKANETRAEENRIRAERSKDIIPILKNEVVAVKSVAEAIIETEEEKQERLNSIVQDGVDNRARIRLEKEAEIAEAEAMIREEALRSGLQLASDIFSSFQDERLAKLQTDSDAEKAILKQRLDDGLISEEQFASQVAAIDQKFRIKSAKAEKKKAIFDIAIATAVAIIKALPNIPLSIAVGVIGGIQLAAVAAKPIPTLAKGEVNINAPSHAQGGKVVEIEGGESYVNKHATSQSESVLNMVNDGILTDKNFSQMTKEDNNMLVAGLLMNMDDTNKQMLSVLLNGISSYTREGITYTVHGNGFKENFRA